MRMGGRQISSSSDVFRYLDQPLGAETDRVGLVIFTWMPTGSERINGGRDDQWIISPILINVVFVGVK